MAFPIKTVFRGMRSRADIVERIEEWASKLETAFAGIQRCDVVVEVPHRHQRQGRQFHVRITLTVPGETIAITRDPGRGGAHEDVGVAIRDAFHAARRRLEDYVRTSLHRDEAPPEPSHGRVAFLDVEGAWGYLEAADGHRVYFHRNSVRGDLALGDEVRFAEEPGDRGPQASSVIALGTRTTSCRRRGDQGR